MQPSSRAPWFVTQDGTLEIYKPHELLNHDRLARLTRLSLLLTRPTPRHVLSALGSTSGGSGGGGGSSGGGGSGGGAMSLAVAPNVPFN